MSVFKKTLIASASMSGGENWKTLGYIVRGCPENVFQVTCRPNTLQSEVVEDPWTFEMWGIFYNCRLMEILGYKVLVPHTVLSISS